LSLQGPRGGEACLFRGRSLPEYGLGGGGEDEIGLQPARDEPALTPSHRFFFTRKGRERGLCRKFLAAGKCYLGGGTINRLTQLKGPNLGEGERRKTSKPAIS